MSPVAGKAARPPVTSFGSPAKAARAAMRDAFGVPAFVLGATYLGFGALVREADLNVWLGLFSTATGWALPGQIALVELYSVGAGILAIAIAQKLELLCNCLAFCIADLAANNHISFRTISNTSKKQLNNTN